MGKKNLILLGVLILAIGLTYIFEEKRNQDKTEELNQKASIIDVKKVGELESIKGLKLNIKKNNETYFDAENQVPFSNKKMEEFFKILSGLKIKKILSETETKNVDFKFYIPDADLKLTFGFKNSSFAVTLGKKLDYDQSFYLLIEKNINGVLSKELAVAVDESPDPNMYQSDKEYKKSEFKFQRLQMLFYLTNVFFYETKVFASFPYSEDRINFKKISISTFRNKKFTIDFEKTQTIPPVLNGLNYFEENWISFHRALTNLEGKTLYYPYKKENLTEPLSIFEVEDRENKKYTIELYKKYGSLVGYFLKNSFNNYLYELRPEEAKYFFINIQDFWSKKIYPAEKEFGLTIQFTLEDPIEYQVEVKDKEVFEVISKTKRIKSETFKNLIDFLKTESDHISEVKESPIELLRKSKLKLRFANRNIGVILEENDVLVVDLDRKLAFHHYVGSTVPFSLKKSDYLE